MKIFIAQLRAEVERQLNRERHFSAGLGFTGDVPELEVAKTIRRRSVRQCPNSHRA